MPKSAHKRSKKKTRPRLKLGFTALIFLVSLIAVSKLLGVVLSLNKPYSPEPLAQASKDSGWNGTGRLNIAVRADNLYLLSFDPAEPSLNLVKIPDQAYFNLPFGFGQWQAGSIYNLGQSEKPALGAVLLEKTLTTVFGLPVSHYIILSEDDLNRPFAQTVEAARQNPVDGFSLLQRSKTDLTPLEYGRLWWGLHGLRSDKIKVIDMGRGNITSWLLLSDGSRVLEVEGSRLDQFVQDNLVDSRFRDEGLTIGVFNGTEHPGLAEKVSREITNTGGRVIFTTNFPIKIKETAVFGSDSSYTSNSLAQIFAPRCIKNSNFFGLFGSRTNCSSGLLGVQSSRADINVIVGEDFYLRFNHPQP